MTWKENLFELYIEHERDTHFVKLINEYLFRELIACG